MAYIEVLTSGQLTADNIEFLLYKWAPEGIVVPREEEAGERVLDRWFVIRDVDGKQRLYMGNQDTFADYVTERESGRLIEECEEEE